MKQYIEPRLRRDFGGVVTAFMDFIKTDIKGMFNTFINYNAVLFLLVFGSSFFMSTGISGFLGAQENFLSGGLNSDSSIMYYMLGILINLVVYMLAGVLNGALSGAYVRLYEINKKSNPDRRDVWQYARTRLGGVAIIVIISVVLSPVVLIISIIPLLIPFLGLFVYLFIILLYMSWISLSIFAYVYHPDHSIGKGLAEGWEILFSKFWKAIGVTFVISIIIYVCVMAMNALPTIVNFYITFNDVSETGLVNTLGYKIFFFVFSTISTILQLFAFFLIQASVGFLYMDLHEHKYNQYLRSRIEKLGQQI